MNNESKHDTQHGTVYGDDVTGSGVINAIANLFTSAKDTMATFNLSNKFDAQIPLVDENGAEHIIFVEDVDTVEPAEPGKFSVIMKKVEDNKEVVTITVLGVALIGAWKTVRLVRRNN